jgi:acyl dehydratase
MPLPPNHTIDTFAQNVGHDFGAAAPVILTQARINEFAACTGDDQWIHIDVERARTQMPGGHTIAHGLLLLSLIPAAQYELGVYPKDAANVLNYGFDKVRFLAPVPAGASVVMRVELTAVEAKGTGRLLARCRNTACAADAPDNPLLVAESLAMVMA